MTAYSIDSLMTNIVAREAHVVVTLVIFLGLLNKKPYPIPLLFFFLAGCLLRIRFMLVLGNRTRFPTFDMITASAKVRMSYWYYRNEGLQYLPSETELASLCVINITHLPRMHIPVNPPKPPSLYHVIKRYKQQQERQRHNSLLNSLRACLPRLPTLPCNVYYHNLLHLQTVVDAATRHISMLHDQDQLLQLQLNNERHRQYFLLCRIAQLQPH